MSSARLFEPLRIGALEIPGRLVKAATAETRASVDGEVTDELLEFYEPIARGGTPLIISGNCYISDGAKGLHREVGAESDDRIPGLRRWAQAVHRQGSLIFGQINHCGRQVVGHPDPVSASAVREKSLGTKPRAMTVAEIHRTAADFAAAAGRLQRAGFDGVQLHMAHGYLLSQFLTPYTNRRTDDYGGSPDARLRFPLEVLRAVRDQVGPDFPIIAKLNGHDLLVGRAGLKTAALVDVALALQAAGLDGVEISVSHYESGMQLVRGRFDEFFRNMAAGQLKNLPPFRRRAVQTMRPALAAAGNVAWRYSEGFNLRYAREFTAALSIPVICAGGWQHLSAIEEALAGGCDAVSAGRGLIADPLLYRHLQRDGGPSPACSFCNACVGHGGHLPVDCYDPAVKAARTAMLQRELGWPSTTGSPAP